AGPVAFSTEFELQEFARIRFEWASHCPPSCPSITHAGPFAFSTEFELQELARTRLEIPSR
ncbi:hypothetical protein FIBSPDRAFT_860311, partial [Athelia psychrophila]